jgi:hypothetical protein
MLALPPDRFDQDQAGGWRPLGARPGCAAAAADLLEAYRKAHWGTLSPLQLHTNYWHEGQQRAFAGQPERAIPLLMEGVPPSAHDVADNHDYALATIAFLLHDRRGLVAARQRLARTPAPADWTRDRAAMKAQLGYAPAWPPNLDIVDGLVSCFGRPYREAYGRSCGSPHKPQARR